MTKPNVVFLGSGPVAAKSLKLLIEHCNIELVITKNKPKHHRGEAPAEEVAQKLGLRLAYADNKPQVDEVLTQEKPTSKLGIVIDYGVILSEQALNYFPLGVLNSHFSLLPKWRGADPITYSILFGEAQTGVSLMKVVPRLDEGPLLAQTIYNMPENITEPDLTEDLIELSDAMIKEILPLYIKGKVQLAPQTVATLASDTKPSYSHKLTKQDGIIDWSKPAEQIEREIRAYTVWPKSRTTLGKVEVIITEVKVTAGSSSPGEININGHQLKIYCGKQALNVIKLKPAGKNEMPADAFIRGYAERIT